MDRERERESADRERRKNAKLFNGFEVKEKKKTKWLTITVSNEQCSNKERQKATTTKWNKATAQRQQQTKEKIRSEWMKHEKSESLDKLNRQRFVKRPKTGTQTKTIEKAKLKMFSVSFVCFVLKFHCLRHIRKLQTHPFRSAVKAESEKVVICVRTRSPWNSCSSLFGLQWQSRIPNRRRRVSFSLFRKRRGRKTQSDWLRSTQMAKSIENHVKQSRSDLENGAPIGLNWQQITTNTRAADESVRRKYHCYYFFIIIDESEKCAPLRDCVYLFSQWM